MYIKILSNNDSYTWGGTLRPEKVTVGKVYEVLEITVRSRCKAYSVHPDNNIYHTWWIYEEDEHGNSLRHHFTIIQNLLLRLPMVGV